MANSRRSSPARFCGSCEPWAACVQPTSWSRTAPATSARVWVQSLWSNDTARSSKMVLKFWCIEPSLRPKAGAPSTRTCIQRQSRRIQAARRLVLLFPVGELKFCPRGPGSPHDLTVRAHLGIAKGSKKNKNKKELNKGHKRNETLKISSNRPPPPKKMTRAHHTKKRQEICFAWTGRWTENLRAGVGGPSSPCTPDKSNKKSRANVLPSKKATPKPYQKSYSQIKPRRRENIDVKVLVLAPSDPVASAHLVAGKTYLIRFCFGAPASAPTPPPKNTTK